VLIASMSNQEMMIMRNFETCHYISAGKYFRFGSLLAACIFLSAMSVVVAKPQARGSAHSGETPAAVKPAAAVTVSLNARSYRAGETIQITVDNAGSEPIYLPGCAAYSLERFQDERYTPITVKRCESEQNALLLPKGSRNFELPAPSGERSILRVEVVYGVGCREGIPLSRAGCKRFDTTGSSTFTLLPAGEGNQ